MDSMPPTACRGLAIQTLSVIKRACLDALDVEEPDMALFRAVVDPALVWELATLVEQLQHENAALRKLVVSEGGKAEPAENPEDVFESGRMPLPGLPGGRNSLAKAP